jgi:hypothetical protein
MAYLLSYLIFSQIEATGESAEPEYKFEALVSLDKVGFLSVSLRICCEH